MMERKQLELRLGPKATAPKFRPYVRSQARHLLMWGGRDSTKSDFVALKLLLDCMQLPYFLCVLIREKQNTIADSQIATLKKVATREGLLPYFRFPAGPTGVLEVSCKLNGNRFIGRGTDDMDRLKSVSDATCAWYEEANQITEADADVLGTSLRTSQPGTLIQEIYTFNPDHRGDYTKFWIYKKFFEGTGNGHNTTFDGALVVDVDGQLVRQPFRVLHSTAQDNPWCPIDRKATYRRYGETSPITGEMYDEYLYTVWYLGLWATKRTGNEFYHNFREHAHASTATRFLPGVNILQSWDANSLPYCAMFCAQTENKPGGGRVLRIFKEYAIRSPNSGITPTGRQFLKDRTATPEWQQVEVYLTGDASMRNAKIGEERTASAFKDVQAALSGFTDIDKKVVRGCLNGRSDALWPRSNPGVDRRRDFINDLLSGLIPNTTIQIDPSCKNLINDLKQVQKGVDGKVKKRIYDAELDASYEPIGHFSDIFDYYVTTVLQAEYAAFKATK
jgi:hypothetical protein